MDLSDVMDEVGDLLDTIAGLRVFRYPPDKPPHPPAAIVSYPDLEFDATYGRGMDRMTLPVFLLVGKVSDRSTRDNVTKWVTGSGADSVKAVLEAGAPYTAFDTLRVMDAEFDPYRIGAVDYLSARLNIDIAGQGAS